MHGENLKLLQTLLTYVHTEQQALVLCTHG